jgi:hypothetical protein
MRKEMRGFQQLNKLSWSGMNFCMRSGNGYCRHKSMLNYIMTEIIEKWRLMRVTGFG